MSGRIRPFIVVGAALPKQRAACDLQGACGSTEEWAGTASCLRAEAPFGAKRLAWHQGCVFCCTDERLEWGVCAFLFLLGFLPVQSPHCSEEAHVPGIGAVLRGVSCNRGFLVSGLIAWNTAF
ncbi:hypothetical protein TCDM_11770 [Trypanosoma cruzi Dm28c]|uniref:Uncharacterized protein n=1 Tax=Trypanosoma cruzi Dm28c TaxID=1416333 RepID=V5B8L4_TRYCR|nr:hypothetical protein TCDM_11770 [Trypanosoma cruzi Dm28c]